MKGLLYNTLSAAFLSHNAMGLYIFKGVSIQNLCPEPKKPTFENWPMLNVNNFEIVVNFFQSAIA